MRATDEVRTPLWGSLSWWPTLAGVALHGAARPINGLPRQAIAMVDPGTSPSWSVCRRDTPPPP